LTRDLVLYWCAANASEAAAAQPDLERQEKQYALHFISLHVRLWLAADGCHEFLVCCACRACERTAVVLRQQLTLTHRELDALRLEQSQALREANTARCVRAAVVACLFLLSLALVSTASETPSRCCRLM
jgi:hypothetical protein